MKQTIEQKRAYNRQRTAALRAQNPDKVRAYHRAYYAANRARRRGFFDRWKYGLTKGQREELMAQQHNACAICGTPFLKTAHVDHDHATGKVRGLLCGSCNSGIGLLQDNAPLLRRAAEYLDSHKEN